MRKIAAFLILAFAVGATGILSGCNTMSGMGKDIERGGEKMQDSARRNQQ
jgi:entericidin B